MPYSYKINSYNGNNKGTFYIQSKGLHAGRPLRVPIANCFTVVTDEPFLFERIYSLYVGKYFSFYIGGSVVPFIRIDDVKRVIEAAADQEPRPCEKDLTAIHNIDKLLQNIEQQKKLYKNIQFALARKVNGKERRI